MTGNAKWSPLAISSFQLAISNCPERKSPAGASLRQLEIGNWKLEIARRCRPRRQPGRKPMPSTEARILALLALAAYVGAAVGTLLAVVARRESYRRPAGAVLVAGVSLSLACLILRIAQGYWPTASGFGNTPEAANPFAPSALSCRAAPVGPWS